MGFLAGILSVCIIMIVAMNWNNIKKWLSNKHFRH